MSAAELSVDTPAPETARIEKILTEAAGFERLFTRRMGSVVSNELAIYWAQQLHAGSDQWHANDNAMMYLQDTFLQYVGRTIDPRFVRIMSRQLAARGHMINHGIMASYLKPIKPVLRH